MKKLLLTTLLVGLTVTAPTSNDSSGTKKSKKDGRQKNSTVLYPNEEVIHIAEHEIIKILLPLNNLNLINDGDNKNYKFKVTIFFVEADEVNGRKEYKGVSIIRKDSVKKLLDTGTDIAVDIGNSTTVYIAATDGLYKYNAVKNTADKYGNIDENLIGVVKLNGLDIIYVLTIDNILYKVTEEGTKKEKVTDVVGAKQIILDYSNNLYYYGADKQPYVFNENGTKKIEGLPSNINEITLFKPPADLENGVAVNIDNKVYIIYSNGNKEDTEYRYKVKLTAHSLEAGLVQYYALDKKIYEFNILASFLNAIFQNT